MEDQIIEKIKKYLDFVATETFSLPGRFTDEDIDKIKSLGYDIRHSSYCDGKILTVREGDVGFSSTKADSEHKIFFKEGKFKNIEFLIYENEESSSYNGDQVKALLKREESPNESWVIMRKDDSTSFRTLNLAPYETLDKEIVDLFLKVKEIVNAYERKMKVRLVINK